MLKERLDADLKSAMKKGEAELVSTLRFLLSQIQNEEIKNRGKGNSEALSEEAILAVLKSEAKRRLESIEMFRGGNREDLAVKEEEAIKIIRQYLPPEVTREEITATVRRLRDSGLSDFNSLMKGTMAELKGRADGKEVSEVVREAING